MYRKVDRDTSRAVDFREIQRFAMRCGWGITEEESMALILRYDDNQDGRLERHEFQSLLQATPFQRRNGILTRVEAILTLF